MYVQKKSCLIKAWRLGDGSATENELIKKGAVIKKEDGRYEVFSRECTGKKGQIARAGDYIKVDLGGYPYPNDKATFEATHRLMGGDVYAQSTPVLLAWTADRPVSDAVRYLLDNGLVSINNDDPEHYFCAELWGTTLTAAKRDILVFYSIARDEQGNITDAKFNFVQKDEFDKTYVILEE